MCSTTGPERQALADILARAWTDEAFKQRLVSAPKSVLQEYGIQPPEGFTLRVMLDADEERTLVLPTVPESCRGLQTAELRDRAETVALANLWLCALRGEDQSLA